MEKKEVLDFFKDLIIIVIVVMIIRTFFVMPFQINGQSMYSSYYDKWFIIVDRLSYRLWDVNRWDVIVFKPHVDEEKKYFLKRVIALPWDELKINDGKVYIKTPKDKDFIELKEWYLNDENNGNTFVSTSKALHHYTLWKDQYFVMWDNRNHSTDSRECFYSCSINWKNFFISKKDITGKVLIDLGYFNFKSFSFIQPYLWIDTTPRFFESPSSYDYK